MSCKPPRERQRGRCRTQVNIRFTRLAAQGDVDGGDITREHRLDAGHDAQRPSESCLPVKPMDTVT